MEVPEHRKWMDHRLDHEFKAISIPFMIGVEEFILAACELKDFKDGGEFRCPCSRCKCIQFWPPEVVRRHLCKTGFQDNYYYWHNHGETQPSLFDRSTNIDTDALDNYEQMIVDARPFGFFNNYEPERPNSSYEKFYETLCAAQSPLWEGCEDHSVLSFAVRLLSIKSDYNIPVGCVDEIITLIKEVLPSGNRMFDNFYQTKKLVSQLGCGYQKIDCCPAGCMLFRAGDLHENSCKFCGEARFKENDARSNRRKLIPKKQMWYLPIIPRLQRLYASKLTAKHMTWHHELRRERGVLSHPSDGEGWKHFNQEHPLFAAEPRNVRLGLCSDGFSPFNHDGKVYSCWPVILTPYNLPPSMCLKREYMFLSVLIPGPSNPKGKIDVYLQPLIDDLKLLWNEGVETYDVATKKNFCLKAALFSTINDFPAYGMLSGWSTSGKLGCPIYMQDSKSFYLKNGKKVCYFDCHRQFLPVDHPFRRNKNDFYKGKAEFGVSPKRRSGVEVLERLRYISKVTEFGSVSSTHGYGNNHHWTKRSIFWDLPYWKDLLNPYNIDVMHTESNIFHNVFNTVMDVKGKTKDNVNARLYLALFCSRPELELEVMGNGKVVKPKAQYTLTMDQKRNICEWVRTLKFPDGYASNMGSCVDMRACTLNHMKSHDCHVFMERLIPIAFSCLPILIWKNLTELSQFFRDLCSPVLETTKLDVMEKNIPVLLCKLEKIFPPSFFDVMEHLPIHLVYEAKVSGPVQYRWMYPFERFLHNLKKKVKNKARVEGSICEAYMLEETSLFCSYYFESHVQTRNRRVPRNDDGGVSFENPPLSIFNFPGRHQGASIYRFLNDEEKYAIQEYVLKNCPEVDSFYNMYIASADVSNLGFNDWFKEYVRNPYNNIQDPFIQSLSWGPINQVQLFPIYFVNDYCFHTCDWAKNRRTNNSGVALSGEDMVYHGILQEIIEVEYPGSPNKRLTLFNCKWFDPGVRGTRIHPIYGLVEVKSYRRYIGKDTFIFAQQEEQVYFTPYPNPTREKRQWLSVIKTKSRRTVQSPDFPFQDDMSSNINELYSSDEIPIVLRDFSHLGEEVNIPTYAGNIIEDEEIPCSENEVDLSSGDEEDLSSSEGPYDDYYVESD